MNEQQRKTLAQREEECGLRAAYDWAARAPHGQVKYRERVLKNKVTAGLKVHEAAKARAG